LFSFTLVTCLTFHWNLIAEQLGFNGYIPSYANARGRSILQGVNYASAAAGIREETGQQLVPNFLIFFKCHMIIFSPFL
jgi:arginyl-tRNA synthetase